MGWLTSIAPAEADGGGRRCFLFYFQDWLGLGRHLVVQGCVQAWCERADMADGAGGRSMITARLTGVTNKELEETYGRLEETGGCGRRMLGLLAGGGSADVAGRIDDWQLEETGGCGRRITGRAGGCGAGYDHGWSSVHVGLPGLGSSDCG